MRVLTATSLSLLHLLRVQGFGIVPLSSSARGTRSLKLQYSTTDAIEIGQRFFQLEEMEDKETEITEVFLNADRTVSLGETDGPVYISAQGTWSKNGPSFQMNLIRTFEAGKEKGQPTDMGEFSFSVERVYAGDMTVVGGKTAVSGVIHQIDDLGDREVGYFNMIDTTRERLGENDRE